MHDSLLLIMQDVLYVEEISEQHRPINFSPSSEEKDFTAD